MISNNNGYRIFRLALLWLAGWSLILASGAQAQQTALEQVNVNSLPGDKVEIQLKLSGPVVKPGSFTIDNPARIALDFPDTANKLPSSKQDIGVGVARSLSAVEAGGRTRVVINLAKPVGYQTQVEGNSVYVTLDGGGAVPATGSKQYRSPKTAAESGAGVSDVDFRRGEQGEGRVVVTLTDPNTPVDMTRRGDQVIVTLKQSTLPEKLERRLDVTDFATPVKTVDAFSYGSDVRLVITAAGDFDHLAYQTDDKLTIDVKKHEETKEEVAKKKKEYTGEKLSLNFQNIEVRAVLQLIADFTGINMVTSDSVKGNVTLRLKNVPWDQALDIILKTKGLDKRTKGNVMLVAPAAEIAAQEKLELEAQKQVKQLAPITSESIQVNYAKAGDIVKLLKQKGNSLLSERGNVTVDPRTNKLLVQDTAANIDAIISLVEELDVPVKQVLIESRIVLVTNNFSKELGVRFGVSTETQSGTRSIATSGSLEEADNFNLNGTTPQLTDRLNVSLPAGNPTGSIGLAIAKLPFGTLLDLELSAAEAEGKSEVISSPKVITADQSTARIETGQEIPYVEGTSAGNTSVTFKKAVLSLEVTPQITPDDRVNMDLTVTKDSADFGNRVNTGAGDGQPPINTQSVDTSVLVNNGETVVLGGVYEQTKSLSINRVPFFADIPLLGALFRSRTEQDNKSELLIFVTPKIIKEGLDV